MVIVQDVRKSSTFIAVIHKKNVKNKKRFDAVVKECRLAEVLGKPMYAIVERGVNLGVLSDMPWKKMVHFNKESDVFGIMKFIQDDIMIGGYYT